jgi:hypothetical protein
MSAHNLHIWGKLNSYRQVEILYRNNPFLNKTTTDVSVRKRGSVTKQLFKRNNFRHLRSDVLTFLKMSKWEGRKSEGE